MTLTQNCGLLTFLNFQPLDVISTHPLADFFRVATMIFTGHKITEALLLVVPDRPLTTPPLNKYGSQFFHRI